jgi:ribosome-binding factor A
MRGVSKLLSEEISDLYIKLIICVYEVRVKRGFVHYIVWR